MKTKGGTRNFAQEGRDPGAGEFLGLGFVLMPFTHTIGTMLTKFKVYACYTVKFKFTNTNPIFFSNRGSRARRAGPESSFENQKGCSVIVVLEFDHLSF